MNITYYMCVPRHSCRCKYAAECSGHRFPYCIWHYCTSLIVGYKFCRCNRVYSCRKSRWLNWCRYCLKGKGYLRNYLSNKIKLKYYLIKWQKLEVFKLKQVNCHLSLILTNLYVTVFTFESRWAITFVIVSTEITTDAIFAWVTCTRIWHIFATENK